MGPVCGAEALVGEFDGGGGDADGVEDVNLASLENGVS